MSYQLKVMQDYPIAFWPLDEMNMPTFSVASYNDNQSTYNEGSFYNSNGFPVVFANDYSGSNNTATYNGDFDENGYTFPLISGGKYGTKITYLNSIEYPISKNVFGSISVQPVANKYVSDNDFSIEAWIYPKTLSSNETPIFADISNNIGLFWNNGRIVFKVSSSDQVGFIPTYTKKTIHVVGIYSVTSISLAIDGVIVATKSLSSFKFSNESISFKSGPAATASESFVIDAPALYRYSLNPSQIISHYYSGNVSTSPIQVVRPDRGVLFSCPDASIRSPFTYSYPESKSWTEFLDSNTYYDPINQFISFIPTDTAESKTFIIEDSFLIPTGIGLSSSKIEWRGDIGIVVESSIDGITYTQCTNGSSISSLNKILFNSDGKVWIRITMSTSDSSIFLPRLSFFAIKFYNNKDIFSDNYGDRVSSAGEYDMGALNYPAFSRNDMNGIRPKSGTGFNISTISSISSMEMIFTPKDLTATTLMYSLGSGGYTTTRFAWNGSGVITKTNIAAVHINGVDNTSRTNIFDILAVDEPIHIVLVFTNPVSNTIRVNYETSGGADNLYNNIAIYPKQLSLQEALTHYNLYTGRSLSQIAEPVITMTEEAPLYYNNDWVVIQTV